MQLVTGVSVTLSCAGCVVLELLRWMRFIGKQMWDTLSTVTQSKSMVSSFDLCDDRLIILVQPINILILMVSSLSLPHSFLIKSFLSSLFLPAPSSLSDHFWPHPLTPALLAHVHPSPLLSDQVLSTLVLFTLTCQIILEVLRPLKKCLDIHLLS